MADDDDFQIVPKLGMRQNIVKISPFNMLDWCDVNLCYFAVINWKDRASWRFVYTHHNFLKTLPVEIYAHVDSYLVDWMPMCQSCFKVVKKVSNLGECSNCHLFRF